MPQIEQNMYLNALNQAKSDIVHRINMCTIYPLPDASITCIFLFTDVSWKGNNMLTDTIYMNLMLNTCICIGTPQMTFQIFCATNLRGECWYIVHYVRVDGLTIKSYHVIQKVIELFLQWYIHILVNLIINRYTSVQNEYSLITLITYKNASMHIHNYLQIMYIDISNLWVTL